MKIAVASNNPVKQQAVTKAFGRVLGQAVTCTGFEVDSGVGDQPHGEEATLRGALNRTQAVRELEPNADYWVGIEGGVVDSGFEMECIAWVVVIDQTGQVGKARSASFFLPPAMAELIRQGVSQGEADDRVFGRSNSGRTNGTIGQLTKNHIQRSEYYTDAVILALIPFLNPEHYLLSTNERILTLQKQR